MNKRLTRSVKDKVIGGVAGGLAEYFEIDPVLVRVLFVVSLFFHGAGFIAYLILWIIVPQASYVFETAGNVNSSTSSDASSSNVKTESENAAAAYFKELDEKKSRRHRSAGIVLIVIGCLFLADNFLPHFHFSDFWPLILIAIGASLLINTKGN